MRGFYKTFIKTVNNNIEMVKMKQVPMIIVVALLFALFTGFLIDAIYEYPEYEDFCNDSFLRKEAEMPLVKNENCSFEETVEERECWREEGTPRYNTEDGCRVYDYCDYCSKEFDDARKVYNRNLFLITSPVGVAAIIFGVYFAIEFLAAGFMYGGILLLAYGTIRYFGDMSKFLRVIVLGVELILMIWLGYKKLTDKPKKGYKNKK